MWILPKNLPIYHSVQDTEALISDSQELCDQLEQSVLWRSKPSSSKTWSRRLKRDCSTPRLFSQTLKSSLGNSIVEEWTSSVEASLVSLLAPQEDVKEVTTQDTCGPTSQTESNDWGDLPLFSLKTSKESSQVNSKAMIGSIQRVHLFCSMSSASWKGWVTKQRQAYSQRLKSVHPISESECLFLVSEMISHKAVLMSSIPSSIKELWLTPATTAGTAKEPLFTKTGEPWNGEGRAYRENGVHRTLTLPMQVDTLEITQMNDGQSLPTETTDCPQWGTPTAVDSKMYILSPEAIRVRVETKRQLGLAGQVHLLEQKQWNTPQARDYKGVDRRKEARGFSPSLPNQVQLTQKEEEQTNTLGSHQELRWATPMAGSKDHMGSSVDYYKRREEKGKQVDLQGQILLQKWTTPIARDSLEIEMNHQIPVRKDGKHRLDTMPRQIHHQEGYKGKLNPRWVETLMGLPIGWTMPSCTNPVIIEQTSLDSWGMELFPTQLQEPSSPYGETWATPQARDYKGAQGRTNREGALRDLPAQTEGPWSTWPTPSARDWKGPQSPGYKDRGYGALLPDEVKEQNWTTPAASQRGDNVSYYLSKNKKRILEGKGIFPTHLQVEVEAQAKGIDLKSELKEYQERQGDIHDLPNEVKEQNWPTPPASQRGEDLKVYIKKSKKRVSEGGTPFAPTLQVAVEAAQNGTTPEEALHLELNRERKLFSDHPELINESILLPKEFDKCILTVDKGKVHYGEDCVLGVIAEERLKDVLDGDLTCHEQTPEESSRLHAIEWFDSNLDGAYMGPYSPVYVVEEEEE